MGNGPVSEIDERIRQGRPLPMAEAYVSATLAAAASNSIFLRSSPWMISFLEWRLVMQDHIEKATVHRQPVAVVIDEAKRFELVHEMTDR